MLDRPGDVDGWWPTRDVGRLHADGFVSLDGRLDDCVRSRDGRLVNLSAIADLIREHPHVGSVAVVPIAGDAGPSFGALVECAAAVDTRSLRADLGAMLPAWARPRQVLVVASLPRLLNGKPDRLACIAALGGRR
jgi:acyl-CoA synthetase (AMP-forming)/AMP-acid ligase II